ncbi:MAG: hypothetical protein KGL39_59100, partial [Patescibacteria group bacterium]|nr:hypothetical protein [Patescibacteria group bacterium]
MLVIKFIGGALDGGTHHIMHGHIPDVIDLPWEESSSRHVYELVRLKVGDTGYFRYWHVKSYRPETQDC